MLPFPIMKNSFAPLGIAPKLLPYVLPAFVLAVAAQAGFPSFVAFGGLWRGLAFAAGLWWAGLGLLFYLDLAFRLLRALKAKRLAERGSYALCRHPLFACWIFFAFPAAALLLDNGLFLLCSAALFVGVARHAGEEEEALEEALGEPYRLYRNRTRFLVPLPRFGAPLPAAFGRFFLFSVVAGAAVGAYSLIAFYAAIAPIMSYFGTTAAERAAAWPGDEWAGADAGGFTQAATIDAPPDKVWPWLVQVGYRRAGWYNIDAINGLAAPDYFYEGGASARRAVPELQALRVGDRIDLVPSMGFKVERIEKDRSLLLVDGDPAAPNAVSWLFSLTDLGDGRTRFVSRFRSRSASAGFAADLLWNAVGALGGAVIQQPAMTQGLKARAEGRIAVR